MEKIKPLHLKFDKPSNACSQIESHFETRKFAIESLLNYADIFLKVLSDGRNFQFGLISLEPDLSCP